MSKPKPIPPDPARDGTWQVVISFRMSRDRILTARSYRRGIEQLLRSAYPVDGPMDVAIRRIGAQGEASQFEGEGP